MTANELRDLIETIFAAGHAAGVVDASDEREADVPIGDIRAQWGKEIDDLVYEAKRKLEGKP